ncbi:APC family permease [Clostridium sp. P21]|uniref:APC family permease n=1 Tax=Clostridium muellerianum TaxID=2716538 RepID=A0A7Y0EKH5_9CLOT|nr:APC family permease [Clostridium muellerianum]NMM65149.1 APC family permease [Clostridium muellerianum]
MVSKLVNFLLGHNLENDALKDEKYNVFWGLPILSSDAISSVAYAGEEILWILVGVIGVASYKYMFYAALCIVFLMFLLVFSYRQTIDTYPNGGGSYIVAKDNLGTIPGLIAGSALSIDYTLTVAVSTCAGTAAITSALPFLLKYKVSITVILIILMTIGNLRGVRESSRLFGIPTYLFILSIGFMIVTGIVKVHFLGFTPHPLYSVPEATGSISIILFLKAFSSGCTALTGIEAVSNGIPSFKEPSQKNAKIVLILLGTVVLFIFGGLSYLTTLYHAVPNSANTLISQIAIQIFGHNIVYYIIQCTTAIILIMAANTAFAGFPLLLALIAKDGFAPRQFAKRGHRLSFSNGIIFLCIMSCTLVIVFHGETHLLIPLYAVGVFISFTLSQTGMFCRWIKQKSPYWRHKAFVNGLGALVTFITVLIIGITKFYHGAWIIFVLIPSIVFIKTRVKKHYNTVAAQLKLNVDQRPKVINFEEQKRYAIVPIDTLNKSFLKALNYARTISNNIIVFHISVDKDATEKLKKKWDEYNIGIPLVIKESPYRALIHPLVKFIKSEEYAAGPNDTVTVVIPQFVVSKWWGNILHNQTSLFIKGMLIKERNIAIVTVPYIIEEE